MITGSIAIRSADESWQLVCQMLNKIACLQIDEIDKNLPSAIHSEPVRGNHETSHALNDIQAAAIHSYCKIIGQAL